MRVENIFEKLADMLVTILHNELLRELIDKSFYEVQDMLLSLLILVNIGVIAYFGTVFIRLYEDVKGINEELENLKQGISKLEHSIKVERTEKEEKFLGI